MAKRETTSNVRYTEKEDLFLKQCSYVMGMDYSDMIRKAVALGMPQLIGNPFCRRVELEDTMNGLWDSVKSLWDKCERNV